MRSVARSAAPDFFAALRAAYSRWDELDGAERNRIRSALVRDFGVVCAYCQCPCVARPESDDDPNAETVDHFRPRHLFPAQWLDWLNLVYCCRHCNQAKGGKWPGHNDAVINAVLTANDARYQPVSEYVNPSVVAGQRPANDYFEFDPTTGEMRPAERLDRSEWSMARRTIADLDLNDSNLAANDDRHLWNRRLEHQYLLIDRLNSLDDFDIKVTIMLEFMLPDKPFSSFITAYVLERFPIFREFFR